MDTRYIEIPLDQSVYVYAPVLTQNISDDEITRLLVGRVNDPDLGALEAIAYFNFSPPAQPFYPSENAVFQKLELEIKFDFYCHGSTDSTDMQLSVHEVLEQLTPERSYYSGSYVPYNPVPVGDTIFALGPRELKDGWAAAIDSDPSNNLYYTQPIVLSADLGQRLLTDFIENRILVEDFSAFSTAYPGFALTMPVGDKILGFTPLYALPAPGGDDSRLILTYLENGTVVRQEFPIYYTTVNTIPAVLNPVTSFTYFGPDRTGTPVEAALGFDEIVPTDGNLYAQSGTGLLPRLDLKKFYDYFDTVAFPVINSAEFVFDNFYTDRSAPQTIELLLLDSMNQFRGVYLDTVVNGENVRLDDPYIRRLVEAQAVSPYAAGPDETRVAIQTALGNTLNIDQEIGKVAPIFVAEFFQQLLNNKDSKLRAKAFAIHPVDSEFKKTVSTLKLNGSSAKLRIYYSTPTTGLP